MNSHSRLSRLGTAIESVVLVVIHPVMSGRQAVRAAKYHKTVRAWVFWTFSALSLASLFLFAHALRLAVMGNPIEWVSTLSALILYAFFGWRMFYYLHEPEYDESDDQRRE